LRGRLRPRCFLSPSTGADIRRQRHQPQKVKANGVFEHIVAPVFGLQLQEVQSWSGWQDRPYKVRARNPKPFKSSRYPGVVNQCNLNGAIWTERRLKQRCNPFARYRPAILIAHPDRASPNIAFKPR
jgi:hypothetical protein